MMFDDILYLDFSSNSEINEEFNRDKIYKVGLREQFEKLALNVDYETFVTTVLPNEDATVGISYPNFERTAPSEEKKNKWFNIAVRTSIEGQSGDLVMMCDLDEYTPKNKPTYRFLKVKGFTVIDKSTETCGEIRRDCKIYTRLEFSDGWYDEFGELTKYLSDEQLRASILTINFLQLLNEQYVAEPHEKVLGKLDRWTKYLDSRKEIIQKDQEQCYEASEGTEVLLAYYKDGITDNELKSAIPYLMIKGQNNVWSRKELFGAQVSPLLHFTHDFLKKDADYNKDYIKKFERFTSDRSLIFSEKLVFKTKDKSEEKYPLFPNETKIQDGRISSKVGEELIPNTAKINAILKQFEQEKSKRISEIDTQYSKEVEASVDSFSKTILVRMVSDYRIGLRDEYLPISKSKQEQLIESKKTELDSMTSEIENHLAKSQSRSKSLNEDEKRISQEITELDTAVKKMSAQLVSAKDDKNILELSSKLKSDRDTLKTRTSELKKINDEITNLEHSISKDISKLNDLREQYETIPQQYPLEDIFENEIGPMVSDFKKEKTDNYREEMREKLSQKYIDLRETTVRELESKKDAEVNEVLLKETHLRLHVFFRLDVESNLDSSVILKSLKEKMDSRNMFLYKDYSGDRAVLSRHTSALTFLRKGYVMNPFLATALFNKSAQTHIDETRITDFFSSRLNDRQKQAICKAVASNGLFLIRGPPGTGKTEVIAEITAQLVIRDKKVLIASENHKAVDNAFDRLPEIPSLRAVRIFGGYAQKREEYNKFATSRLTRNFYLDIAKCLDDEIRKTSASVEYADKLDTLISEFKLRSNRLQELKGSVNSVLSEISETEEKIARLNKKIARENEDNLEYDSQIYGLQEEIRSLENGEREVFEQYSEQISIGFNGNQLDLDTIQALYHFKKTEINKEFLVISEHPEFFTLFEQKATAPNDREKNAIEVKILEYQNEHGINAYETRLLKIFPNGIPSKEEVIDLKEQIMDSVDRIVEDLNKKIEKCRSICNDTSRMEQELHSLEKELQELRNDSSVQQYEKQCQELNSDIRKVLVDNNIVGIFKTPEEGIEFIETEKSRIKKSAKNGLSSELRKSYKRMSDYLKDESVIEKDGESLNESLLYYANVIGLTCTTRDNIKTDAGTVDLKRANLDVVIVDEVSKVSFLEVLYPILYGKTVILVGDDKQLPPTYQSTVNKDDLGRYDPDIVNMELEREFQHMYETSFFRELYNSVPECNKTMLTVQYRMHPDIMEADNIFYDNQLTYGGTEGNREHYLEIKGVQKKIISPKNHLVFIDTVGEEIKGYSGGTSCINYQEIDVVLSLLKKMEYGCHKDANGIELGGRTFDKMHDPRLSLGVICGYSDQAKLIRNKLKGFKFQSFNRKDEEQFMVDTVDNFQGDERDIIILSLVRSDPTRSFMTKFNRINVAISRARCLLVIVGNAKAFSSLKIELDGKQDYVYRKIVDAAKRDHGYFTASDVLGE